jgi:hypothetical protein
MYIHHNALVLYIIMILYNKFIENTKALVYNSRN